MLKFSFDDKAFEDLFRLIPHRISSWADVSCWCWNLSTDEVVFTWGAKRLLQDWYLHMTADSIDCQLKDFTSPHSHTPLENFVRCIFNALLKCADWKVFRSEKVNIFQLIQNRMMKLFLHLFLFISFSREKSLLNLISFFCEICCFIKPSSFKRSCWSGFYLHRNEIFWLMLHIQPPTEVNIS